MVLTEGFLIGPGWIDSGSSLVGFWANHSSGFIGPDRREEGECPLIFLGHHGNEGPLEMF